MGLLREVPTGQHGRVRAWRAADRRRILRGYEVGNNEGTGGRARRRAAAPSVHTARPAVHTEAEKVGNGQCTLPLAPVAGIESFNARLQPGVDGPRRSAETGRIYMEVPHGVQMERKSVFSLKFPGQPRAFPALREDRRGERGGQGYEMRRPSF